MRHGADIAALAFAAGGFLGILVGLAAPETAPPALPRAGAPQLPLAPVRAPEPDLERLLRALPAPEPGALRGTIWGRILTASGQPLAGVRVQAQADLEEPPPGVSLEEVARRAVERHRLGQALAREALSDAEGRYVLTGLGAWPYALQARHPEHRLVPLGPAEGLRPHARLDFRAERQVALRVVVRLPSGEPAAAAELELRGAGGLLRLPWSPEQPELSLEPGKWTLRARARRTLASAPLALRLGGETPHPPVVLHLTGGPAILGRVELPWGEPALPVTVAILPWEPGGEAEPARLARSQRRQELAPGEDFSFPALSPGSYLVGAGRAAGEVEVWERVELGAEAVECLLRLPNRDPRRVLRIRALSPAGEPLQDLSVHCTVRSPGAGGEAPARCAPWPDGSLAAHPARAVFWEVLAGERPGSCLVRIRSPRYGERVVELGPGGARELVVQFEPVAELEVTVVGSAAAADAAFLRVSRAGRPAGEQALGPTGRVRFAQLAPGDARLELRARAGAGQSLLVAARRLNLRPGANAVDLELPLLHRVLLVVPGADEDGSFELRPRGAGPGSGIQARLDAEGRAELPGVPAGAYLLRTWTEAGPAAMPLEVRGPGELRFEAAPVDALRVRVDDPAGYLAELGLHSGDQVLALDGQPVAGLAQVEAALARALPRGRVTLGMARGDQRFEAEAEPARLRRSAGLGGELLPLLR